jgi:predicted PurR-regulated permease PerM
MLDSQLPHGAHPFLQRLEGNFLTAIIMKNQVSLLSAYTLALLTASRFLFGFLGVFLALPILIVIQLGLKKF